MSQLVLSRISPCHGGFIGCLRLYSSHPLTHDRFRMSLGLTDKLNKTKELQDYQDYSFKDGRPSPVTPGQLKKIEQQRQLAAAAVQHLKEIQYLLDRDANKKQSQIAERQSIIDSKLKPKGDKLRSKKKSSQNM